MTNVARGREQERIESPRSRAGSTEERAVRTVRGAVDLGERGETRTLEMEELRWSGPRFQGARRVGSRAADTVRARDREARAETGGGGRERDGKLCSTAVGSSAWPRREQCGAARHGATRCVAATSARDGLPH